jgi:hypothetical protein
MSDALDLSELVNDPDFCRSFSRIRRTQSLANEGQASTTPGTPVDLIGYIEPASQADLKLLPEGTRLVDMVGIFTVGDVRIGDQSSPADLVVVDGVKYLALHIEDFRASGGYIHVLAQMVPT